MLQNYPYYAVNIKERAAFMSMSYNNDVTVIGTGWSGLVACNTCWKRALSFLLLPLKRGRALEECAATMMTRLSQHVMKSTFCTSSSTVTEMSDFLIHEEVGLFPHNIRRTWRITLNLMQKIKLQPNATHLTQHLHVWGEKERWNMACDLRPTPAPILLLQLMHSRHQIESWKKQHSRGIWERSTMPLRSKSP